MRQKLWSFDTVTVDLEDGDASVTAVHKLTGASIHINFRLKENQITGLANNLREKIEFLATDQILDLSSFLDLPNDVPD